MLVIESWHREVVIDRVHFKTLERINRSAGPLPDVSSWIEDPVDLVLVDGCRLCMS